MPERPKGTFIGWQIIGALRRLSEIEPRERRPQRLRAVPLSESLGHGDRRQPQPQPQRECFTVEMSHSAQGNPQGSIPLDRCTGKTWLLLIRVIASDATTSPQVAAASVKKRRNAQARSRKDHSSAAYRKYSRSHSN